MPPQTQLRGTQILDGSITADDVDDSLEKELTKVRVTIDDSSADFLSSKIASGTGISVTVDGAPGTNQKLRIASTGSGVGGGTPASTVAPGTSFDQPTAVGSSIDYARADHQHGTPPSPVSDSFMMGMFGDCSDGDVTIAAGTTTLSREMHYGNLTLAAGASLKTAGNRIFVNGTLTYNVGASINDNGNAGNGAVGGAGWAARGYLGGASGAGGAGWSMVSVNQANGNAGTSSGGSSSLNNSNIAPTGGAGGNSTTRTGGVGGTAPQPTPSQKWSGRWLDGRATNGAFNGGSGGGGGALTVTAYTSGTFISGGGGSGGGIVWVAARHIVGGGIGFSANGGAGANGSVGVGTGTCAGGGGGGGGNVTVICKSYTGPVSLYVMGGGGGSGAATAGLSAGNGLNGQSGNSTFVVLG